MRIKFYFRNLYLVLSVALATPYMMSGQGLQPFTALSNPTGLFESPVAVGSKLFYVSSSTASGKELWVTNGTEAGCHLVKDIYTSTGSSNPHNLMAVGNTLFFWANDGINGDKLWITDGTETGTKFVNDQSPDGYGSNSFSKAVVGNRLVLQATTTGQQLQLYAIDEGGSVVKLSPVTLGGNTYLANLNDRLLYFQNQDSLFIFNETLTSKSLLKTNLRIYGINSIPKGKNIGNKYYFSGSASGNNSNYEPWVTDGTIAGTVLLKDINPTVGSLPTDFTEFNGNVYFSVYSGPFGNELYRTDGTSGNTDIVKNINLQNGGATSSNPNSLTVVGDSLYFLANDGFFGEELYVTAGTEASTRRLTDLGFGSLAGEIQNLTSFQGKLMFRGITYDTIFERHNGVMTKFKLPGASFNGSFFVSDDLLLFPINYGIARIFPDLTITNYTNSSVLFPTNLFQFANRIFGSHPTNKLFSIQESELVSIQPLTANSNLLLYPNPAQSKLWIASPEGTVLNDLEIIDVQGRCIYKKGRLTGTDYLDVSNLPTGIFQILVSEGNRKQMFRFLKN